MKYLLDTHALLWIVTDDPRLGENTRSIYLNEMNQICLSMASIWEMVIKISIGKLQIPGSMSEFVKTYIRDNKIDVLSIELKHLYQLENLTFFHRDPFDRLIIAQSMVESLPILSQDAAFDHYPIQRIW